MSLVAPDSVRTPLTLLVNARSGGARRVGLEARLQLAFERAGRQVAIRLLEPSELETALVAALDEPPELLFVGAGDGSLATAARLLRGRSTSLAVLPLGTRNHFARELGIPLDPEQAVTALLAGNDDHVDLGQVNGRLFLNNVSIGVYPRAVERRAWHERNLGVSRPLAMARACVDVLLRMPRQRLRVRAGEHDEELYTPLVLVGNNEYLLSATDPVARRRLDGAVLSVYTMRVEGPGALVWTSLWALLGDPERSPTLKKWVGARVVVDSPRPAVEVALDGELDQLVPPLEFESLPRSLRVRRPRRSP